MLESIKRRTTIREEFRWLIGQLVHGDYALIVLFQNAAREVEKRWFHINLGQNSKVKMLYGICDGFDESEIVRSISAYKALCDDANKKEYCPFKLSAKKVAA